MRTVMKAAQLIDGTGAAPIQNGCLMIEDQRIVGVGVAGPATTKPTDVTIDLPGCTILPGLVDAHSHLASDPGIGNQPQQLAAAEAELAMRSVAYMRRDLLSGVTTSRLMSEKYFIDITARRLVSAGLFPGPRFITATRGIRPSHGHGASPIVIDGADNMRRAVRENLRAGADLIKLFLTGSIIHEREAALHCGYTLEEIRAAVDEAHGAGKPVAVHAHGGPGIELSLAAGVDSIEHGSLMTPSQIDRVAEKGMWVVLTLTLVMHDDGLMRIDGKNPVIRERILRARDTLAETASRIIASGGRIAVGSDALHGMFAHEASYLVQFGMPPLEAIACCTRHGAALCGILNETGTLETGKRADLIAIEGDPLSDISALRNVRLVVKDGQSYDARSQK